MIIAAVHNFSPRSLCLIKATRNESIGSGRAIECERGSLLWSGLPGAIWWSAGPFKHRSGKGRQSAIDAARVQTEFSRGFGDWLISNRVALVCSSYLTGYLLFIGVRADSTPVVSAASFSMAMDLSAFSQRIYLGTKNEIWRLENVLASDELAHEIFDRFYVPRSAELTGDINIHELGVDGNGNVLFVNSRYSCLATVSATTCI